MAASWSQSGTAERSSPSASRVSTLLSPAPRGLGGVLQNGRRDIGRQDPSATDQPGGRRRGSVRRPRRRCRSPATPLVTRASSSIFSVAAPSQFSMAGPQRCQASAAASHCVRVVFLNVTGSKLVWSWCSSLAGEVIAPPSVLPTCRPARARTGPGRDRFWTGQERGENAAVKDYVQYCPVALASSVIAERWTPLIVRELVLGGRRFNEIDRGLPGISRSLLKQRLDHLERKGVVERVALPHGGGHEYQLTPAGRDLEPVIMAVGEWAVRWMFSEPEPREVDPVTLTWWMSRRVVTEALPERPHRGGVRLPR